MEQAFRIGEQGRDGAIVVSVIGEVDVATAPALRDRLGSVTDRAEEVPVVVDLSGVTFIDSTGLGVLIGARKRCEDDGRVMHIIIVEPRILKVFDITGLTEFFSIHPTLDAALAV